MYKIIHFVFIISVLFTIKVHSMTDELDHEGAPLLSRTVDVERADTLLESGVAPQQLLQDEVVVTDLSLDGAVIYDESDLRRKKLALFIDRALNPRNGKAFFGPNHPLLESALLIYNPRYHSDSWTNGAIFLSELDERAFRRSNGYLTWILQMGGGIYGMAAPWGWGPLVMYLSQSILRSKPVPYIAAQVVIFTVIGSSTIPCSVQMWERGNIVGNSLFDRNGFTKKTSQKGPHLQKLKTEIMTGIRLFRKSVDIPIPIHALCRLIALTHATVKTAPLAILFWHAEEYFPVYRGIFIGPLSTLFFEKAYKEALEGLEFLSYRYFTNQVRMKREKEDILLNRLRDMRRLINSTNASHIVTVKTEGVAERKSLIDLLYEMFLKALKEAKSEDVDQRVSAASLLFLKRIDNPTMIEVRNLLNQASRELHAPVSDHSSRAFEMDNVGEAIDFARAIPIAQTHTLIEDISYLPGVTSMRRLLEYLSIHIPAAGQVSQFLIPLWTIPKIFETFGVRNVHYDLYGLELDPVFCGAIGISLIQMFVNAASEWYLQHETFLGIRNFGSRSMPFWPLRWTANLFSFIPAVYAALPGPAIIFMLLPDSPTYLKILLSACIYPSEMTSFFHFFRAKYETFIRGVTTTYVKTVAQKRAFLDREIENLMRMIPKVNKDTIEQLYNLTQKGI